MTDPQIIIDDVIRGKAFLADIVHNEILAKQAGIPKDPCEVDSKCLFFILKALDYKIEQDEFDTYTEKLYRRLILIIGKYIAPTISRFYYGVKDTSTNLTELEILASPYIESATGSNPIITFNPGSPKYNWMAEFSTEPIKTKWQDTVVIFNNGNIGTIEDTFGPSNIIGIFRFYDTEFLTQFQYPIQFKIN